MKTRMLPAFPIPIVCLVFITLFSCSKGPSSPNGPRPIITGIFPDSGHFGTTVLITGKNFDPVPASNTVTINGVRALVQDGNDTSLHIIVPISSTGIVAVKTNDSASGPIFNYTQDVLIPGVQTVGPTGNTYSTAVCWVNGIPITLTNATSNAAAKAVATLGNDVYVVGYEFSGGTSIARLWKNAKAFSLNDGTHGASANAIAISGKDVYIAGYESDGSKNIATVWKNGTAIRLTNGEATAISVLGNNVYVGGQEVKGIFTSVAKLWKNGVETALTDSSGYNFVTAMALSGNDIYEVGYGIGDNTTEYVAKAWQNGVLLPQIQGSFKGYFYGIYIDSNDIYYAGSYYNIYSTKNVGSIWKNNILYWTVADDAYSQFDGVVVKGNDVYVAGQEYLGNWLTKFYKNQKDTTYNDISIQSIPYGLLIK